jgi:hypothetical protein
MYNMIHPTIVNGQNAQRIIMGAIDELSQTDMRHRRKSERERAHRYIESLWRAVDHIGQSMKDDSSCWRSKP